MTGVHDPEQLIERWLDDEARPMPDHVLEAVLDAVPRVPRRSARGWLDWSPTVQRAVAIAVVGVFVVGAIFVGPRVGRILLPTPPGGIGGAPGCVAPPSGIAAWWPGEGTGRDLVGGHDAQLTGSTTYAPGLVGQAFAFDGGGYVAVPDADTLDVGVEDFAVALWVRFADTSSEQVLAEKWVQGASGPSLGWTLTKLEDQSVGFFTEGLDNGAGIPSRPGVVSPGRWLHVAARRRAATFDLFLDGELVASNTDPNGVADLDSVSSLKFGYRGGPGDTPGSLDTRGFNLHGRIDEVTLFIGQSPSDDQILDIYRAGGAGMCRP